MKSFEEVASLSRFRLPTHFLDWERKWEWGGRDKCVSDFLAQPFSRPVFCSVFSSQTQRADKHKIPFSVFSLCFPSKVPGLLQGTIWLLLRMAASPPRSSPHCFLICTAPPFLFLIQEVGGAEVGTSPRKARQRLACHRRLPENLR